jgi:hypothetical protein
MSESPSVGILGKDRALLQELGRVAAQADPVPDIVYASARAAFALRDLDAELAHLVEDSTAGSGVRSGATDTRLLSFEAAALEVELEISYAAAGATILGQVVPVPAGDATVRLFTSTGEVALGPVDELGAFRFDGVPQGLVRLQVEAPGAAGVTTPWVRV